MLKVFVSAGLKIRKKDFCHVPAEELVIFDSGIGKERCMIGTHCKKGTTICKVVELDITEADYRTNIIGSNLCQEWIKLSVKMLEVYEKNITDLLRLAKPLLVGVALRITVTGINEV